MKLLVSLAFVIAVLASNGWGHKQSTHQYIVREAWTMLQAQGFYSTQYSTYVGTTQHSDNGNLVDNWVVAGAWNEDDADMVFKHGTPNNPLDAWVKPFTSVTHFWRIPDAQLHAWDNNPSSLPLVGNVENAWQKMQKFRDGGWDMWIWVGDRGVVYRYYSLID